MTDARPRYVVLHHVGVDAPHFDVMLERAPGSPTLRTFRSPIWPIESETPLTQLPDHRRAYLDYEGAISGGRGSVTRVEAGEHRLVRPDPGRPTSRATWQIYLSHDGVEAGLLATRNERGQWVVRPSAAEPGE